MAGKINKKAKYIFVKRVHLLPPEIISKIAAGEVIERPASALKELLENALDAAADQIEIRIKDAGKTSLLIRDNGQGIEEEDLEEIFERHATSKIRSLEDLFAIASLGFRGEALYSIAAISDITLKTRTKTAAHGWKIHLRGGKKVDRRPDSFPKGTEIEVKELFFNTPARKKFLKSDTAELQQILNIFLPYALLYPQKRFLLTHQDRTLYDLSPTSDRRERLAEIFNLNAAHFLKVAAQIPEDHLSLTLLLSDINIQRPRKDVQFLFVNNRPVHQSAINFSVNQKYRLILPPEKHPAFAIFLELPPEDVDVNVHPTKREVKIKDESRLISRLRQLCEETLLSQGSARSAQNLFSLPSPAPAGPPEVSAPLSPSASSLLPFETRLSSHRVPFAQIKTFMDPETQEKIKTLHQTPLIIPEKSTAASFPEKGTPLNEKFIQARYIGAFLFKYLLFEASDSLLVVDQHAAQERIVFENLLKQITEHRVEVQYLLAPIPIALGTQEILLWEETEQKLTNLGFQTTLFDKNTLALHAHPQLIKNPDWVLRHLLSCEDLKFCDLQALARRACRKSIMTGDKLNPEQAENQRRQLLKCHDPFTCPHGRPILIEIPLKDLDKQFFRT